MTDPKSKLPLQRGNYSVNRYLNSLQKTLFFDNVFRCGTLFHDLPEDVL